MNKKLKTATTAAVLAVTTATVSTLPVYADNAYRKAQPQGWFWYEDPAPQKQEQVKPKLEPVRQKPAPVKADKPADIVKQDDEPFSAPWVRKNLQVLLERAITNPTEENVRAYKYMERVMSDMSTNFANMSEKVVQNDPMLDESVRFPISSMARAQALSRVALAKDGIIRDLKDKAGLWMFFDSKCSFCHSQYETTRLLAQKHGLTVHYISTDGGIIPGMATGQIRYDRNAERARTLGIKLTPAVVLVAPPEKMAIVAHGAMAQSELEEKIVLAAIDMKLANPELSNLAKLQDRGILSAQDMAEAKNRMRNPDNPDELVKMLNEMIRRKM